MMEISFNQVSAAILLWNLTIQTLTSAQFLYCRSFTKAKKFWIIWFVCIEVEVFDKLFLLLLPHFNFTDRV